MSVEKPDCNEKIFEMIDAAGGQTYLAQMLNVHAERNVTQPDVWRYCYHSKQFPETLVPAAVKVAQELGVEVELPQLRPSLAGLV